MTLDLSEITEALLGLVKPPNWGSAPIWTELGGSPTFTPNFTGLAPDAAKGQSGPQLSLYLYHVESDNAQQSLSWQPWMLDVAGGEPIRFQPLALDLFYLLFAYSEGETGWTQEQEAMSVALRIFHENPIVRSEPGATVPWELTLTMEHRSYDELSRLWQATTAPLRMSVVYRAAVVFIDPDPKPESVTEPETTDFSVTVDPVPLPLPEAPNQYPVLFGTERELSYVTPGGTPPPLWLSNTALVPGQNAWLLGSYLGVAGESDQVYLLSADGTGEVDITAWTVPAESTTSKFALALPAVVGSAPTDSPAPGVYLLRVGSGTLGSPGAVRSGSISITVAAYVDPAPGPVLSGSAPFTVTGAGFTSGQTEVLVGTTALADTSGTPAAGQVKLDPFGTSFSFAPPAGPSGEVLPVRVRVSGIESDPALWVTL
jgi:hypothetical protein